MSLLVQTGTSARSLTSLSYFRSRLTPKGAWFPFPTGLISLGEPPQIGAVYLLGSGRRHQIATKLSSPFPYFNVLISGLQPAVARNDACWREQPVRCNKVELRTDTR